MKCIQNFGLRPLENRPLRRPRYLYESCIVLFLVVTQHLNFVPTFQTPRNHPKERTEHSEHGLSLKSRIFMETTP